MFLTTAVRHLQGKGKIHYIPQHLSKWTRNLFKKSQPDIFWGSCSVPDERGFVSLGPGACYEPEVLSKAKVVILEMNPNIPVTFGSTHVPVEWVDYFVESSKNLPTISPKAPSDLDHKIAAVAAKYISDGSTLQLGIGGIPNAVAQSLDSKKDLGIHTEMINDAMMHLYKKGIVTGKQKSIWPGKIVGAFAFGTNELYEFLDSNPIVELQPASVVNDPYRIGRNNKMVSINTAVEIDITGQVCSESIGHLELSGVGGATDTHIGAQLSEGGRGIIAMHARTNAGASKIVFELKAGAKVSISRNDIDTVITEYGAAELSGANVGERAHSLIGIAHPDDRMQLHALAEKAGYL